MAPVALTGTVAGGREQIRGVRLLLIRHGEALCNVRNIVAGERACHGLTAKGHRQATGVAERLACVQDNCGVSVVYTSPVARAVQTAQPIAAALQVPLVCELPGPYYGAAEGKTWRTVLGRFSPPLALTPDVPMDRGAEPWAAWVRRVGESLDALAERHHSDTVILVCHRESIIVAERHFQRGPATLEYATAEVDHTSITEWESRPLCHPTHRRARWVRLRHNDILHMSWDSVG